MHQRRAAAHGSAPWRSCLVTRQHVLACFRAARLGAGGSDHDHRERHSCARRSLSRPARPVTFRVIRRPAAATEDIGALRADPGDEHCPGFSCIKHVTIALSLVCACSSGAATEVGPCLARAGGSRELRARRKLHVVSGSGRECEEPPWPNGQGVGLLIRRLRVQVPQGVLLHQYRVAAHGSAPWRTCLVTRQARAWLLPGCSAWRRRQRPRPPRTALLCKACLIPSCTCPVPFRVLLAASGGGRQNRIFASKPWGCASPGFRCTQHMTTLWSLVCACSSDAATGGGALSCSRRWQSRAMCQMKSCSTE